MRNQVICVCLFGARSGVDKARFFRTVGGNGFRSSDPGVHFSGAESFCAGGSQSVVCAKSEEANC
jgi:hypothetical protein